MSLADAPVRSAQDQLVALLDKLRHVETVERDEDGKVVPVPVPITLDRLATWAATATPVGVPRGSRAANGPAPATLSNWLNKKRHPGSVASLLFLVAGVRDHRESQSNLPTVLRDQTWIAAYEAVKDEKQRDKAARKQQRQAAVGDVRESGPLEMDSPRAGDGGAAVPDGMRITPEVADRMLAAVAARNLYPAPGVASIIPEPRLEPRVLAGHRRLLVLVVLLVGVVGGWGVAEVFGGGLMTSSSSSLVDPRGRSAAALIPDTSSPADREVGGWPSPVVAGHAVGAQRHTPTRGGQR